MIQNILQTINNTTKFEKYTEFNAHHYYSLESIQSILSDLKKNKNNVIITNNITKQFNMIGVVDIDGKRYIDFDDDIWTMTNKGIIPS
jgi:hypothetical protein